MGIPIRKLKERVGKELFIYQFKEDKIKIKYHINEQEHRLLLPFLLEGEKYIYYAITVKKGKAIKKWITGTMEKEKINFAPLRKVLLLDFVNEKIKRFIRNCEKAYLLEELMKKKEKNMQIELDWTLGDTFRFKLSQKEAKHNQWFVYFECDKSISVKMFIWGGGYQSMTDFVSTETIHAIQNMIVKESDQRIRLLSRGFTYNEEIK